ncbi:hypothetical protein C0Q70_04589 [Pomacea canaliculata]|uniref:Uncharacterized protein n=1 Tax=Pomacea canaliculata TaxID=400727 RepID=A0A2T7PIT4_POMCA|nr:hypothetical protein C0Q70_04589 [Pomacea canaliculata]
MNKRRYGRPRGLPYRAERCEQTHVQTNTRPARAGIESRGELAEPSGGILRAVQLGGRSAAAPAAGTSDRATHAEEVRDAQTCQRSDDDDDRLDCHKAGQNDMTERLVPCQVCTSQVSHVRTQRMRQATCGARAQRYRVDCRLVSGSTDMNSTQGPRKMVQQYNKTCKKYIILTATTDRHSTCQ